MSDIASMGLDGSTSNPYLGISNPYLQQMIDATSGDVVRNYNLTARPQQNVLMINSGSFGNSGLQELQNNQDMNLQGQLGQIASQMRGQDYTQQQGMYQWQQGLNEQQRQFNEGTRRYDQNFGRDTFNDAYAQNMGNLQAGIGLLGTMGGYNALDYTNASNLQNAPLNYYNQFANIAGSLGGMGGTTQGSTTGGGSSPLLGLVGGAQLGNSWWNQYQNSNNQQQTPAQNSAFDSLGSSNNWWGTGTS